MTNHDKITMKRSFEIVDLLIAISRLPEDRPVRNPHKWFLTQKEHWIGWLSEYNSHGAYGRKITSGRDARFAYNHIACPEMLAYLAKSSGVSRALVHRATQIVASSGTNSERSGAIRRIIPWEIVETALIKNRYARLRT